MRFAILGGGVSGLAAAYAIEEAGLGSATIFEKEAQWGGLASSKIIDGYVVDLHGGHVFNTAFEDVKKCVFTLMPEQEWGLQVRKAKILCGDRLIDYPFEFALHQLAPEDAMKCLSGYRDAGRGEEPVNFYDWLLWKFGKPIAERHLIPYNEKIMACDLRTIGTSWIRGKMPIPSTEEVERAFYSEDASERLMPHSSFYYPKKGGIQSFVDRLAGALKKKVCLNYPVVSIEKRQGVWVVNGERGNPFDVVISTISIKSLIKALSSVPQDVIRSAESLAANQVTVTLCESEAHDISWLYIPDKNIQVHRMVFLGGFAPGNCAKGCRSSVLLESIGSVKPQTQAKEINRKISRKEFQVGRVVSSACAAGYIVQQNQLGASLDKINEYLDSVNILRVGRFARWHYDNMDVCIHNAFELVRNLNIGSKLNNR